jgi:hypothetical protein
LCVFLGEKVPDWKFSKVNDKRSFARNSVGKGKILNRVVMMDSAMTLGATIAVVVDLVAAWRRSAFV